MVEAINHIGHVMGKHTIAEFAENDQVLASLSNIAVDFGPRIWQACATGAQVRVTRA
jgi:hypothetical protein